MKYWLKKCPRCRRGDLWQDRDIRGTYIECLQCGYVLSELEMQWLLQSSGHWVREEERTVA